ncbi:MAG: anti-sigma regulatory factor [Firmicutes bacterium]|nr:anti-sigma regulatory factor [Bacillota bacterium]
MDLSPPPSEKVLLSQSFDVAAQDFVRAGEASSRIKRILQQLGIDSKVVRRSAIVTYEAEMNIVIHSHGGGITLTVTPTDVILQCIDRGPGIENIPLAMQEGYSTASEEVREMGFGAGMGLPNIKRSADEFRIESSPSGTALFVRISHRSG